MKSWPILLALAAIALGALLLLFGPKKQPLQALVEPAACEVGAALAEGDAMPITMRESSDLLGAGLSSKTFALSVSDVSGDGRDDILIGAHEHNPFLLVNTGAGFQNKSEFLTKRKMTHDRHGYTLADLDNDGDLDVAVAGGGADGVGQGAANVFLENRSKPHKVVFRRVQMPPSLTMPASRSRALIPVASRDGKAVDLYSATLARDGFPNRYLVNTRPEKGFMFEPEDDAFFSGKVNDAGRGTIADLDGDGTLDYLVIVDQQTRIYWDPATGSDSTLLAHRSYSTSVADFNNDGLLDIYIGSTAENTRSARVSASGDELIFTVWRETSNNGSISFTSEGSVLDFDLSQHIPPTRPGEQPDKGQIFLGTLGVKPDSRVFTSNTEQAAGAPTAFQTPGTYVWFDSGTGRWHIRWAFPEELQKYKGSLSGDMISDLQLHGLESRQPECIRDILLLNAGDRSFSTMQDVPLGHHLTTSATTTADFDNDGWVDILGIRYGEEGAENGQPFILRNVGGESFTLGYLPIRAQDRLHRADLVAHGFFDDDDKPDVIITNGFGQNPGTWGEPRLLLNDSASASPALRIDLRGTTANRFGIGAQVRLFDQEGNLLGFRVQGINSNISQDTHTLHFGLGDHSPPYRLSIAWPDGPVSEHSFDSPGRFTITQ